MRNRLIFTQILQAAHSTIVDDVYRGVVIPAGSVIMANAW